MAHKYEKFVVIKILSQRNDDLEQYVCIPKTWIKVKDCDNDDVVFGYPSEQRDNIARLINQSLDKRWPTLFGEVVHKTDSQKDAFEVLKNKNSGEEHKTEDQSEKSKPENKKTKATFENEKSSSKKIKRKRKQTDSGDKTQNKQAKAKRSKDDEFKLQLSKLMKMLLKGKDSDRHESPSSSSSSEESDTEESEAEESESISNEDNDIPTTSRRSARAQSSKPDGYYRHIDDSSDSDYVPGYDTNSKNKSTVKKGRSKRKVSESNRSNQSEPSDNNENDDVDISDTNLCQINDEVHNQCRNFYTEVNDSFKKTMSILDNAVNYFQQVKEEVSKVSGKKSKDDRERFKKFSESQPPFDASRYSTGDTKWTILYPGPCPGLVELMPRTGVYVSEEGLNECKKTSKDATTLARALLNEIFKMEALFVCSFTGSVPKRGSMNNLKARPGLDVKARETLVCYAKEYGCEENMDKADKVRITNSIKNALQKYHSLGNEEKKKLLKKQASSKVNFMK
ncbi:hypothetical protein B5X24_HaOG208117 [Helicoverpa armigera]|uniref:BEN domain-containing protein n=1 Tax=Helicoverpa armigera TaxID=29058 RepID=A0A2W1BR84_HELAM|nr:hypothetical protein B5X24_HaOG208117 [Helicoverpa armigera]